jgi:alkylation response protein AidB-like acyl-CoA dehydrogenase
MEATERALFESGVRHATEQADGTVLDAALDDLGWRDALDADQATAVSVLFGCQGATTTRSAALDWLLATALGEAADGSAVILPPLRATDVPARLDGDRWVVEGLATAALDRCERALVVAQSGDGPVAFVVAPADLLSEPVGGIDPSLGLSVVTGAGTRDAATPVGSADWPGALALGQLALGHELVGTGRLMLELARTHALERVQFGRAIGSFQAVRHRLAETLVALEAAAALLEASWEDPSPVTAAMAKAFAGRSARTAARNCQQVLAGIGFTTEHPLHRSIRRTLVLDQLLGAGSVLTRQLGAGVLENAVLPAAFPL